MKAEMYLENIFQEFPPEGNGHSIPIAKGWPQKGGCPCRGGGIARIPDGDPRTGISNVFLRREEFGGLLFDPRTSVVYSLDQEAYSFLEKLQLHPEDQVLSVADLSKKYGVAANALNVLRSLLMEASIWPHH